MNLTTPSALLWAALAVPIVIFYILKIRRRRTPVSTVMFWEQVFEDRQPRSLWQTLRHLLSLLLQLFFLILLVLALADPFFNSEVRDQRRIILVLDNSASMRATDVAPSRLDAARAEALRLIRGLRPRDEMAVIAAGTSPRVVCGLTSHQRTLRDFVEAVPHTDGPTRVSDAVVLARRLLDGHPRGQIAVLSDGCFLEAAELAAQEDVFWSSVVGDEEAENVGITRFQVRRSLLDPVGYEILVEVSNLSGAERTCRLELELAGELLDVIPLELAAAETWSQVFRKTSASGGQLVARLDHDDALAVDNTARAILPQRTRVPVTLVSPGNLFLERVLQANALVDLTVLEEPPEGSVEGVLILHNVEAATIPAGRVFVLQPRSSSDLWELGDTLENPIAARQEEEAELLRHVRLQNVLMPEAAELTPQSPHQVLVESATEHPLYVSFARPEGDVLVLSVNLERGDLPLRTAFPIMMTNALASFADRRGELREALTTGTVADVRLPTALQPQSSGASGDAAENGGRAEPGELVLAAPDGRARRIPSGTDVTIGPLDQAGVWRIRRPRDTPDWLTGQLEIACNLSDPAESDLRVPEEITTARPVVTAGLGGRPVWFLLVLLAWLLTAAEWFLYQRRWIS